MSFVPEGVGSGAYLGRARPKERLRRIYTSKDPNNVAWANDKEKFGFKLLEKMGWSEGKGLGRELAGATSHIKVDRKFDNAGIGAKANTDDNWISTHTAFESVLKRLNSKYSNGDKSTKTKDEPSQDPSPPNATEQETSESEHKKSKKHKKKKKKHHKPAQEDTANGDGDGDDGNGHANGDESTSQKPSEDGDKDETKKSIPSKAISFHKRVTAKRVSNYSAKHMAEILGRKRNGDDDGNGDGDANKTAKKTEEHEVVSSSVLTSVSTLSTKDYFAMRMAQFGRTLNTTPKTDDNKEEDNGDYDSKPSFQWSSNSQDNDDEEAEQNDLETTNKKEQEQERKDEKKKKKKNKKKHTEEEQCEEVPAKESKRKKKD